MAHTVPFKLVALVLVAVLLVVAGTPAKAEAMDALTILAIAGLAAAGLVIIAFLIIANVEGDKVAGPGRVVWMACADADADGCTVIPAPEAEALIGAPAVGTADREGP
jgi:hypothetical protein